MIEIYSLSNSYMRHAFTVRTCSVTVPSPKKVIEQHIDDEASGDNCGGLNESVIIK
jgi:hypothetical protein